MLSTACLLVTEQVIINPQEIMNYSHWAVHLISRLALCGSLCLIGKVLQTESIQNARVTKLVARLLNTADLWVSDPDPSIIKQKKRKTLNFVTSFGIFIFEKYVNEHYCHG
jgi:hypothetical protein